MKALAEYILMVQSSFPCILSLKRPRMKNNYVIYRVAEQVKLHDRPRTLYSLV